MRALLLIAILLSQTLPVAAACNLDPRMRQLSAITRYCVVFPGQNLQGATERICDYDCLISRESVSVPASAYCPITVKQRLYSDGTREIIANEDRTPAFTGNVGR
jgi:hypothetical protein